MQFGHRVQFVVAILACCLLATTAKGTNNVVDSDINSGSLRRSLQTANTDVPAYPASNTGTLSGIRQIWHKQTLGFRGPSTGELAIPNPFTDFRLDVTFSHASSGTTHVVPGYYACDGNAANTQAINGNVWLTHFAPDREGTWTWRASFTQGTNVALQDTSSGASAGFFDGSTGSFEVFPTDKIGRDHRRKGRLDYVPGRHHLQFQGSREWFLKAGVDSPENMLAYDDFDNTPNNNGFRKSWSPHQQDYRGNDPTWAGGRGSELIGAINYLSGRGLNAFSFLTMNIIGDDENVFPYISDQPGSDRLRMDVSKLAQWEVVFEHADQMGMFLHFKTQETENDRLLDGGALGVERRLYYRELISRFGHHLALNWNLGEENRNTEAQQKSFAAFFKQIDPYRHPIVLHTHSVPVGKNRYLPLLGDLNFDGASLQIGPTSTSEDTQNVFNETRTWWRLSEDAGRPWVICNDEQGPFGRGLVPDGSPIDPEHDIFRTGVLWGNIMAGGAGVEYYFGTNYDNSDLTAQNFRTRTLMWDQSRHALDFFRLNNIPFWNMENSDTLSPNGWSLVDVSQDTIVIYVPALTERVFVDLLEGPGPYTVQWYRPKVGGPLVTGSQNMVQIGSNQFVGNIPAGFNAADDGIVLLRRQAAPPTTTTVPPVPPPSPSLTLYLVNAEANMDIRRVNNNNDSIQLSSVNTNELSLRVEAPTSTSLVLFTFTRNGDIIRTQREGQRPYSASGDRMGDFNNLPLLLNPGVVSLMVEVFELQGGVQTLVNTQVWTLTTIAAPGNPTPLPPSAPTPPTPISPITLYLVDAEANRNIQVMNTSNDSIQLSSLNANELSMRVGAPALTSQVIFRFSRNGQIIHTQQERQRPFSASGDRRGDFNNLPLLLTPGALNLVIELFERQGNVQTLVFSQSWNLSVLP